MWGGPALSEVEWGLTRLGRLHHVEERRLERRVKSDFRANAAL
jgi:hypothetical protein